MDEAAAHAAERLTNSFKTLKRKIRWAFSIRRLLSASIFKKGEGQPA
jgi:hypothetical protein